MVLRRMKKCCSDCSGCVRGKSPLNERLKVLVHAEVETEDAGSVVHRG